jgi:hypothetical protein
MTGRIKVGLWLPFSARQECDGRSFAWRARVGVGPLTVLAVVDRFAHGRGIMDGRLFGRIRLFHAEDENTTRSAAGRAALEAVYTPQSLLPQRGVIWRAESESEVVATWDMAPERPELQLQIDDRGAVRSYHLPRWSNVGQKEFGYIPCGCEVAARAPIRRARRAAQYHGRLGVRHTSPDAVLQSGDPRGSRRAMSQPGAPGALPALGTVAGAAAGASSAARLDTAVESSFSTRLLIEGGRPGATPRTCRQKANAHRSQGAEGRHRPAGRARREHQFEQWDRVADPFAQGAQRAVATIGDDKYALTDERHDRRAQQRPTPAG